jgi:hypothetical protein
VFFFLGGGGGGVAPTPPPPRHVFLPSRVDNHFETAID